MRRRFGRHCGLVVAVAMVAGMVGAAIPALPASAVVPDNITQSFISGATAPFGVVVVGDGHIYWANSSAGTIGRANMDGTGAVENFISGASIPSGVVLDSTYIYWANQGNHTIGRALLDGTGVDQSFVTTANGPVGVVVNSSFIYWSEGFGNTIGRANLDGSGVNDSFITGANVSAGVMIDSNYIYWANQYGDSIGRANLDGTSANPSVITGGSSQIAGIDVDSNYIYWANITGNTIGRANLDGSGINQSFIIGENAPVGVWVRAPYLYWTNSGNGTIGRANLIDVPDPPTIGTATAGAGSGSVTFTPGANNGSPIASYTATCTSSTGVTGSATGTASPIVVTGLTDGASYTCTVTATNGVGMSMPSPPSNMFTPVAVPGAPTIGPGAAGGVGSAVVSFTPPANNGGSPIVSFTATCFSLDGEATMSASGTGSPITVTGLVAATPYECSVAATNAVGTGPPSGLSNVFGLPSGAHCTTVPSAPLALSQAPGNGSAVVSWAPPLTGASCLAGYVVTPYLGTVAQLPVLIPGQGTTTVVSGLVNGLAYTFTVTAENGPVEGPPSAISGSVTVGAPAAATVSHVTKVAKGSLKVAFTVPKNNGSPITSYTATCTSSNGGLTKTKVGRTGPLTVSGLSAGKSYTCTVRAANKRGTGPPSHASATIKA